MGKCVTLMTNLLIQTNCLRGKQYLRGIKAQAKMFPGAIYEKRASFLISEIVLIANKNL
jgi:hypothetical protein